MGKIYFKWQRKRKSKTDFSCTFSQQLSIGTSPRRKLSLFTLKNDSGYIETEKFSSDLNRGFVFNSEKKSFKDLFASCWEFSWENGSHSTISVSLPTFSWENVERDVHQCIRHIQEKLYLFWRHPTPQSHCFAITI